MSAALALVALLALLVPGRIAAALERVPAVIHVHSDLSTGDLSLDEVASLAEKEGLSAVFLAENYLLRIEYGLPLLRSLTRVGREERSVLLGGIDGYLARVAAVAARYPKVTIVPGVEVVPHYYWSGSPFALEMRLHDVQKNLLVFGVEEPATLARLTVTGNPNAARYAWPSLAEAGPSLLLVAGVLVLATKRREHRRTLRGVVVIVRRRWLPGLLLCLLGGVALARAWPFTIDVYPPWRSFGLEPYQTLIDQVNRAGGATVWSFPEAADFGQQWVGPVRVIWQTDPYPDDLLRTFRYSGFGALYEQPTRFTRPGGSWDRLLGEYARGERSRPGWAVGESGFHGRRAGKHLGPIQTVLLADERSPGALVDALKNGRMYALRRTRELGLTLADFSLGDGRRSVAIGQTLQALPGTPLEVRIAVESSDGAAYPLRVTLVRNGVTAGVWAESTTFRAVYRETFDGHPAFFRLEARGPSPHQILSNALFVRRP